jgi:hypothetical protein
LEFFYILAFSAGFEGATSGFLSDFAGFLGGSSLIFLAFCSTGFYFFSSLGFTTLLLFLSAEVDSGWAFFTGYLTAGLSTFSNLSVELSFLGLFYDAALAFC